MRKDPQHEIASLPTPLFSPRVNRRRCSAKYDKIDTTGLSPPTRSRAASRHSFGSTTAEIRLESLPFADRPIPPRPVTPNRASSSSLVQTPSQISKPHKSPKKDPRTILFTPRKNVAKNDPVTLARTDRSRPSQMCSPYPRIPSGRTQSFKCGPQTIARPVPRVPITSFSTLPQMLPGPDIELGNSPAGCLVVGPDAVGKGPLDLPASFKFITVMVQWPGYDVGPTSDNVLVKKTLTAFETRFAILKLVERLFLEFKKKVAGLSIDPEYAVFNLAECHGSDVRVTKLVNLHSWFYQAVFTVTDVRAEG